MKFNLYELISSPSVNTFFTKRVFYSLIRRLEPDMILDIGSRDGSDALGFKRAVPTAEVIAYEANPALYQRMCSDTSLSTNEIKVEGFALADYNGQGSFKIFMVKKGTGSLLPRRGKENMDEHIVDVRRLDSLHETSPHRKVALWIDVEGNSYEVIKGCGRFINDVVLIHAEVESEPLFEGQLLRPRFVHLMGELGFRHVDGGILKNKISGNEVFLRSSVANSFASVFHITGLKISLHLVYILERIGLIQVARIVLRPVKRFLKRRFMASP